MSATLLVATVAIAFVQVVFRYVLNSALSWPEEMARFAFVWFVFLAAAMVTRRSRHVVIDLLPRALGPGALRVHACAARIVSAAVAAFLLVYGADLVLKSTYVSPALEWPYTYLYLAVPSGAAISLALLALEPVAGFDRGLERRALDPRRPCRVSRAGKRGGHAASWAPSASSGRW